MPDTLLLTYLYTPRLGLRADRQIQPVLALGSGLQPPSTPLSTLTLLGLCLCRKSWLGQPPPRPPTQRTLRGFRLEKTGYWPQRVKM